VSYATEYTASHPTVTTPNFAQRVEMALIVNAGFIYVEDPNNLNPQHPARAVLAMRYGQTGAAANAAPGWVELCAAQALTCDATTTDAQIDGVISSRWNMVAGA
jgi:hypothetical protein